MLRRCHRYNTQDKSRILQLGIEARYYQAANNEEKRKVEDAISNIQRQIGEAKTNESVSVKSLDRLETTREEKRVAQQKDEYIQE
jgi:hypothetical protein